MNKNERWLCFDLGKEEFAIPLLSVREVLGLTEITPVPQTPSHFLGIMNLRGQIISVLDLRTKLGVKPAGVDETAIIILDLGGASLGMVVDRVNSVHETGTDGLSEKPSLETSKANEFVVGVFKKQEHLVLALDVAKALSVEDHAALKRAAA